ncbi:hypothetical protein CDD81_683 [Ophiocordyceps australis]|uniref:Uncharacterized protein n=1 Tax=Ophiocordyceps australis TaxID=1399860 RepID=A0A2C5Y1U6_9HYPO|nr:hypothetical protein CDD81_683 [Ophiocordyceps australis]
MPAKRDYDDLESGETTEGSGPKRRKYSPRCRHQHQNSDIDATWGQKYVFSAQTDATSIPYGDESDFEDDADAMAYLRSVRTEAQAIPHMLTASTTIIGPQMPPELQADDVEDTPICENVVDDVRGYYQDGAYVARPTEPDDDHGSVDPDSTSHAHLEGHDHLEKSSSPQLLQAYFASILTRYHHLRRTLHTRPPQSAMKLVASSRSTPATLFKPNTKSVKTWYRILRQSSPHPVQLALLHKSSVFYALQLLLGGRFLRRGYTLSERTSQWLWGLLARLPSPEEMGAEEVACVRDIGRRAVLLGRSLSELAEINAELYETTSEVDDTDSSTTQKDENHDDDDDDAIADRDTNPEDSTEPVIRSESPSLSSDPVVKKEHDLHDSSDEEEGEITADFAESESEAMELAASDSDVEGSMHSTTTDAQALRAAKEAFLARLAIDTTTNDMDEEEAAKFRLRLNLRATLDMVLTVTGEYYGQRDLLDFREPFLGL